MTLKVLSLFSGVGGFDMGLEAAGMTTVFQCEIDKHARSVLDHHWPTVPKWDDVTTLTGAHILEQTGGVDVVAWGSPCQDLSLAGKRAGLSGERSGLFHEGIRIIKELRELSNGQSPTWSIWENVVGALSSNGGADFGEVLAEMDEAGACFSEWAVLDAQHFGVPQRRRRVFLTSCFNPATSERCPDPLFPVTESLPGDTKKGKSKGQDTSSSVAARIGTGCEPSTFAKSRRAQSVNDHETWVESDVTNTLNVFDIGDVRTTEVIVEPIAIPIHDMATRFNGRRGDKQDGKGNGLGIGHDGEPMLTLTQGDRHAVAHEPMLLDGTRVNDVRVYTEPTQTLTQRMGTGGNNVPMVAQDVEPIVFAPGAMTRLGGNVWEGGPVPTLRAYGKSGDNEPHVVQEQDIVGSLQARDYKGVGNQYVAENKLVVQEPILSFDTQFGSNANVFEDQTPTLKASQQSPSVAMPGEVQAVSYDGYNQKVEEEIHRAWRIGIDSGDFVADLREVPLVVRRLTPLECERLMGWPDQHTSTGVNGVISDTQRYRMCGNGVASPVAEWVAKQLVRLHS